MGTQAPQFLGFQDRELCYGETLILAILAGLQNLPPSKSGQAPIIFLPSLSEPHPDHQATALAGLAAAQRWGQNIRVVFCEMGAPLHPNAVVDSTSVAPQKWQALACFTSQLGIENYEGLSRAMASFRAFGKHTSCTAAEAFFEVDTAAVQRDGPLAALPQWPWARQRLQLANQTQDLPLVSVLIRSMNRPSLPETLASLALQTYPHIEWVIVNASGREHASPPYVPARQTCRVVNPEDGQGLGRSAAANLALTHAQGNLAMFVDDDDLIAPDHIQRLVQTLHQHGQAVAAYSGVRVVNAQGQTLREYDTPWSSARLQGINFLPIHAVLFRMQEVRAQHLRFDTTLPVLEDWEFWLQLSEQNTFVHSQGITATYRQSLGQSGLSDPAHDNHWQAWHLKLLSKRIQTANMQDVAKCLAWHAIALDRSDYLLDQALKQQTSAEQRLSQATDQMAEKDALIQEQAQVILTMQQNLQQQQEQQQHQQHAKLSTWVSWFLRKTPRSN